MHRLLNIIWLMLVCLAPSVSADYMMVLRCPSIQASNGARDPSIPTVESIGKPICSYALVGTPGDSGQWDEYLYADAGSGDGLTTADSEKGTSTSGPCDKSNPSSPRPVVIATGEKYQIEADFSSMGPYSLALTREYRSNSNVVGIFGRNWLSTYDNRLNFVYSNLTCSAEPGVQKTCNAQGTLTGVELIRPDGSQWLYTWNAERNVWDDNKPDSIALLKKEADGSWTHETESGIIERYNSDGFITSLKDENNVGYDYSYTGVNVLYRVTHTNGRYIQFSVSGNKVTSVTDPAGKVYTYTYNSYGYLESVKYPGLPAVTRTYHYEDPNGRYRLTGISINGIRYSTYSYYLDGKVKDSGLVNGVEKSTFSYSTSPSGTKQTTVTNALGQATTYSYAPINGYSKLSSVSQAPTSTCPYASKSNTYDSNGFLSGSVDWNGNWTRYTYSDKGLIQEEREGDSGSGSDYIRKKSYYWDPVENWLNEVVISSPAGIKQRTAYVRYTSGLSKGRIQSITKTDYSAVGSIGQESVTYSYGYTGSLLTQITVDGPATDIDDTVVLKYDSYGNLLEQRNALGQKTTYSNYNAMGLVGRITQPDGSYVDYVYDDRGRLKSSARAVNGAPVVTTYAYTALGKLSYVSLPDSNFGISYSYDAAGRLTGKSQPEATINDHKWTTVETLYSYDLLSNPTHIESNRITFIESYKNGEWIIYQSSATQFVENRDYDSRGRLLKVRGNNGQVTELSYDNGGNVKTSKDAYGFTTIREYDKLNRLSKITNPSGGVTTLAYDVFDNLVAVTDPRNKVTSYSRDGFGYTWNSTSPDTGSLVAAVREGGRLSAVTRNDGSSIGYGYDSIGRLTSVGVSGLNHALEYDSCSTGKLCRGIL